MSDPPDLVAEARRWLCEARQELSAARVLVDDPETPLRLPAFWCHLAAEKALKGLATARGIALRNTHKLFDILAALPDEDSVAFHVDDLQLLDPWQAAGRYPGDVPDQDPATIAALLAAAEQVLATAERLVAREA
jgi:HEPN domain-containing protein